MEQSLSETHKRMLLEHARIALEAAAERRDPPEIDLGELPEELRQLGASFVTLTKDGALRGCIGTLEARVSLVEDVREHARAAALHDFRFPQVQPDEVDQILIEISILSEPEPLEYDGPDQLLERIQPGVDGVIITEGKRRATFLPQVWDRISSPTLFFSMLCEKAGLQSDAWKERNLQVFTYQAETIHEESQEKS
ncbi:MAG: AmmeMemoRadiSam system protein A [Anaerolineales bacterium]|nr:AmmeMemoRadiSam system protein A [Anaerolineales bacterium]